MTAPSTLPAPLRSYLSEFVVRRRRLGLLCGCGYALLTFGLWMLVWCSVDRFAHLPSAARAVLLAAGTGATGYLLVRSVRHWLKPPDWVAVAEQVEQANPRFGQKLITVTSQVLATPDHRGSDQMLGRLSEEVSREVEVRPHPRHANGIGRALGPWAGCLVLVGLSLALLGVPGFGFGQLAVRFVAPLADVPAVTTTRLDVSPGDADVVQSQPVTIEAHATQLGDASLTVYLSDNQRDWSAATMTPSGGGAFNFTIQSVDRDLRYYVSGGDARSPAFSVRVLRRPAVARFTVRYTYPSYTRLAPATASNEDGRIEAPVGTHVALTVTATEPLRDAVLSFDGQKLPTQSTPDPASRRAEWDVGAGGSYDVELTSVRDVRGSGPAGCAVRALPDLPPQVRLLRGGESLSQAPREIVPISYEVLDDFAVASVTLRSQLNSEPPALISLKLWGDPRRQQDVYNYDLAAIPNVAIGDVLTLTLVAGDSGGHEVASSPLQILVSPRTVDLATYQLIVELGRSAQLSRTVANALLESSRAQDQPAAQPDRRAAGFQSSGARADRALSNASQTAGLLRQSLLKAVTHSGPTTLSRALVCWVDEAEVASAAAQEAFRQSGAAGGLGDAGRQALSAACTRAVRLADDLETVYRAEQADATARDLHNLEALRTETSDKNAKSRRRVSETLGRMRQEITAQARQLGLDATAPDFSRRLDQVHAAGDAVAAARASNPVDYGAAVALWARELAANPQKRPGMDARLSAAAQAEAIRSDADLSRARDLDVTARAATGVAGAVRAGQADSAHLLKRFLSAAEILLSQPRLTTALHPPATQPAAMKLAEAARTELLRLSGVDLPANRTSQAAGDAQKEIEDLAMQANAASASRQYDRAAELEAAMHRKLKSRPRRDRFGTTLPSTSQADSEYSPSGDRIEHRRLAAEREMNNARRVDDLDRRQTQLARRLEGGDGDAALARQQQTVADEIDGVRSHRKDRLASDLDQPDGRERATAEVLAAIEQLAGMPQSLAEAQTLAGTRRFAAARARSARQAATRAAGQEQRAAAGRAAADAETSLRSATERLTNAGTALRREPVRELAGHLAPYAPETDGTRDVIENRLIPSLDALEQALAGDDAEAADGAAAETREVIAATQRELAAARDLLVKRDPLAAARWFAHAAASSLSASPPDISRAKRHQAGVFESLSRAWDQSIHRAATERLSVVPSLSGILGPPVPGGRSGQGAQPTNPFANAQEWGRLRDETAALDPSLRDTEPPGYEQPLKLYFEALGRAGDAK